MTQQDSAVVLLSGGQDSTTCFYWALDRYERVEAVSFDYGQRHAIEITLAARTAIKAGVPHKVLPVDALRVLGGGSLTNDLIVNTPGGAPAAHGWHAAHGLPPSFVPGRNLLFFTLAAAYSIPRDITTIVTGVCQQDEAGYPDCRAELVTAMELAIRSGMDTPEFRIVAPLLALTKAETWKLADNLGRLQEIMLDTSTCYEGDRTVARPSGYGCGVCGACVERERGYTEFRKAEMAERHTAPV